MLRFTLLLVVMLAVPACSTTSSAECRDCNVVLLSIDTLRADHLGVYGYSRPTSPTLDAFSREGVVFDSFFGNGGATLPVHMSMMTSLEPVVHGVNFPGNHPLPVERLTLAEVLSNEGWSTGAFTDGGWMREQYGFSQGFDTWDEAAGGLERILPKALDWISKQGADPFFLFLHTYDVHSKKNVLPYECPGDAHFRFIAEEELTYRPCVGDKCASKRLLEINRKLERRPRLRSRLLDLGVSDQLARLYDGCISYVDSKVSELLAHLRELGIYDETLIIVTSDHGEAFLEHGRLLHARPIHEEVIRVPLLVKFPHSRHAGRRVRHLGSAMDLAPTILQTLGTPVPEDFRGRSLLPAVVADRQVRESISLYQHIRTSRWKYIKRRNRELLFDLQRDPRERRDLAREDTETLESLRALARTTTAAEDRLHAEFLDRVGAQETHVPDQTTREELEALGYVQ